MLDIFKTLNLYFFNDEDITLSDSLWFYGTMGAMILITIFVIIPALITNIGAVL